MRTGSGDGRDDRRGASGRDDEVRAAGSRLRAARLARSWSQLDLAQLANVSRQAVAALEAGRSEPSLRLALALAEALGSTVEELFGHASVLPLVDAVPVGELGVPGSRVALAPVGGRLVALALQGGSGVRTGFTAAGGVVGAGMRVRPLGALRPTLALAGCDPALGLLETPLGHLDPPVGLAWHSCSSAEALELARAGLVHVAGIHVRDPRSGHYNLGAARRAGSGAGPVVGFAGWRQGLVVRPELVGSVGDVADVARLGLRLVDRELGSEARTLLDDAVARAGVDPSTLAGRRGEVRGHLEVAEAIACGLADAGVASEPAALAFGLGFVPWTAERFDLVVGPGLASTPEVRSLLRVLASPWLRTQLARIPGYDASSCGEELLPAAATTPERSAARPTTTSGRDR